MAINRNSTKPEIVAALKEHGYEVKPEDGTQKELLDLLSAQTGVDYMKQSDPAKAPKKATERKMRRIFIPSGESKVNQGDVFVGHNGNHFQLKRDTEMEVPEEVVSVLRGAKQRIGIQKEDGSLEYRDVMAVPFNIVD